MRNNDEYNSIEIKNESGKGSFEYGTVQKAEFTSFTDNKNNPNRDELNPSTNRNNENVKKGFSQTNNNDIIDKAFKQPMGATETTGATSEAAASATGATVTSASSAAAASGTVAGTVVAATVVAVTAIGTGVGITAISNNNASVKFDNIYIGETFMSYALELKDTNNTEFRLYVESASYLAYNVLQEGPNEGFFEMLQSNQTYRIYVKEQTDSQKIIYDSTFTTMAEGAAKPRFDGVFFSDSANYLDYTFTVTLSYFDENENFSNFILYMYDYDNPDMAKSFELQKTTDPQTLSGLNEDGEVVLDVRHSSFGYSLSYVEGEEEKMIESEEVISFSDSTHSVSEVRGATISDSANYLDYTFGVTLDVQDDFDVISDFNLVMVNVPKTADDFVMEVTIPLLDSLDEQIINYSEYNMETPEFIRSETFSFTLKWVEEGDIRSMDLGEHKFTDNSGIMPEISGAYIASEANFIDYTFEIQLGYVDELDKISAFYLDLEELESNGPTVPSGLHKAGGGSGYSQRIELIKTTDLQIVDLDKNSATPVDIRTKAISFTLVWVVDEQEYTEDLGSKQFTDNSGTVPEVTGATFGTASFLDLTFEITLQYVDILNQITSFVLEMNDYGYIVEIPLAITTETQTVNYANYASENPEDLRTSTFTSTLKYMYKGQQEYLTIELGEHQFVDEEGRPSTFEINGVDVSSQANFTDYTFTVTLDYNDPYSEIDPDRCSIYLGNHSFPLELTSGPQIISAKDEDGPIFNLTSGDGYDWLFTCFDKEGNLSQMQSQSQVVFTDEDYEPYFYGVEVDEFANFATSEFYVTLDYTDVFNTFSNFRITFTQEDPTSGGMESTVILENTTKKQTILASENNIDITSGGSYNWELLYDTSSQSDVVGGSGTVSFQNKYESNFNALITNNYYVTHGTSQYTVDYILPLRLDYDNRGGNYHGLYLSIDGEEFELQETTSWQYVDITEIKDKIDTQVAIQVNTDYYDYATSTAERVNLYSETVTLVLHEDPEVYGATMGETSIPYSQPAINLSLLVYDYSMDTFDNYQLIVKTSDNTEYSFDISTQGYSSLMGAEVSVDISNESELVTYLQNGGAVTIYLGYRTVSTQDTSRVTVQENVVFDFYA